MPRHLRILIIVLALNGACDNPDSPTNDPQTSDAPTATDAASADAPWPFDASPIDAYAGRPDAASADAGPADARPADASVDARPPDICGDRQCTGSESTATCCVDCGCPSQHSCRSGTCVRDPWCGDGTCNGGETSASCCRDCGCPGGHHCNGNACECTGSSVRFTNVMPDAQRYCPRTGTWYTQQSVGYMSIGGTLWYLPDGAWVSVDGALGGSYAYNTQCCYLDACLGNLSCRTPTGNFPCLCAGAYWESGRFDVCGLEQEPICQ